MRSERIKQPGDDRMLTTMTEPGHAKSGPLCLDLEDAERLRAMQLPTAVARAAAARSSALGDPTRLALAALLSASEELCVADLAWVSGRAQNLVSHHLRTLRQHRLVHMRRSGKLALYGLTAEGHALLRAVLGGVPAW
jgi:ArsR family transcriptional regulator, lead/cadmium/zinc/bismuth-responsive transcriptional repressor